MRPRLSSELAKHEIFKAELLEEFPDTDDETLADTLEGLTDLQEMIAATLRSAQEDIALIDGLKRYATQLAERYGRMQLRADKKRAICLDAMERANLSKITAPDFTASLRSNPPKVVIIDETKIPEFYFDPQPAKLNKTRLMNGLKNESMEGATLSNPQKSLTIRSK